MAARDDARRGRVVIALSSGVELGFMPRDVEGSAGAKIDDLRATQVKGMGLGVHFPRPDVDLYLPALLEGVLGFRRWMAARLTLRRVAASSGSQQRSSLSQSRRSLDLPRVIRKGR